MQTCMVPDVIDGPVDENLRVYSQTLGLTLAYEKKIKKTKAKQNK